MVEIKETGYDSVKRGGGSEGFCENKGRIPAMDRERLLPCFGPEEEPVPDSPG